MKKKIKKKIFLSDIIASQLVSVICNCEEQDTCHCQPTCWQIVPRFGMSIRDTFANSIAL